MFKKFIGNTKNGFAVYFDSLGSHAATHFMDTPELFFLVVEALADSEPEEKLIRFEKDMGRIIGSTDLFEIQSGDDIVYAKRISRNKYTPFVKNRSPQPTPYITLELQKSGDKEYNLYTAYIGRLTPSIPGGEDETPESRSYWAKHALIWGTQAIVPGTETKECPW
ncbi:MAG: hypothetical protein Q7R73_04040 [bacterium]|nr:hypothetical protein [bacterium]